MRKKEHSTMYIYITVTLQYIILYNYVCLLIQVEGHTTFEEIIPIHTTAAVHRSSINSKTVVPVERKM